MSVRYAASVEYSVIRSTYLLFEYKTVCAKNDWAELSTCNKPTGEDVVLVETVIYMNDR